MEIRKDQMEYALEQLETHYKQFANLEKKQWMSADDKLQVRRTLETSLSKAQQILSHLGQPGTQSAEVQHLQSKLILWSEMAAHDVKATHV